MTTEDGPAQAVEEEVGRVVRQEEQVADLEQDVHGLGDLRPGLVPD